MVEMESKNLGKAIVDVMRICELLDPRWKSCSKDECVNDGRTMRTLVEEELEDLVEVVFPESSLSSTPVSGDRDVVSAEP